MSVSFSPTPNQMLHVESFKEKALNSAHHRIERGRIEHPRRKWIKLEDNHSISWKKEFMIMVAVHLNNNGFQTRVVRRLYGGFLVPLLFYRIEVRDPEI